MAHDRYVELERHPLGGFGLSVIGGVDTHLPPMVCAIVHHGSAQLSGKVFSGDVILEVNRLPITQFTTSQVVETIRNTQDNLRLRLRDDPGSRERARPYLRPFAVADPKLAIYQARLKRSASAPNQPRNRAHTDQLPRKGAKNKEEQTMQRGTSTSSDDIRTVGRLSLMGLEEGADGIFIRRQDGVVERLITDFPVESSASSTRNDKISRPQDYKRKSYPDRESRTSKDSIPRNCTNCGELIESSTASPGSEPPSSPQDLRCKKCGRRRKYSAGGSSLPETPYAAHTTLDSSPFGLPAQRTTPNQSSTKINGNLNYLPYEKHSDDNTQRQVAKKQQAPSELKTVSNGGVRTERVLRESSDGSSTDTLQHKYKDLHYESSSSLAKRLFRLEGFGREDVAPELSKNTTYGKSVATEYLKFFDFCDETITESLRKFLRSFDLTGETQERERILIPFSKRYHHCNDPESRSEDSTHTLVCAALLLNSDLHGENIGKKMTQTQFIENLAGLCDGKDFPKEQLKTIYQEIKANPLEGFGMKERMPTPTPVKRTPTPNGFKGSSGNPFVEIQSNESDKVYKEGLLYRKVTMSSEGKKTSVWKRKWIPFYGTLKGTILFLHKSQSDEANNTEQTRNCLGVHHSLASRATDYIKRPHVFRFVTSDWREFLFQARNRVDMTEWIEAVNLVAATYSSPPLPAPIGSCKKFQRPVLPFSRTQLSLTKQVEHHEKKSAESEEELIECLKSQPKSGASVREEQEWQEKKEFLEYEYKRYKTYVNVLRGSKLESKLRDKPRGSGSPVSCVW